METLLSRYRNLTVLLLLLMAQLLLLAYQVKTNEEVRLIRIWAVTAVTPVARLVENLRAASSAAFMTLARQREVLDENNRLREQVSKLQLHSQYVEAELATADRARVLLAFQKQTPSKTSVARIIGTGTGANARVVYVDRGSAEGIQKGMAVITANGIVGKVVSAYPTASLVTLITQQGFAAGVVSQKKRARGTLKGIGLDHCVVDYLPTDDPVEDGEWFFTTGDDRVFPKGLPVGQAKLIRKAGREVKEVEVVPAGLRGNLEEVLIVVEGVHGKIPDADAFPTPGVKLMPPPPEETSGTATPAAPVTATPGQAPAVPTATGAAPGTRPSPAVGTDADRIKEKYRRIGESQGVKLGAGYRSADFNKSDAPAPAGAGAAAPGPVQPGAVPAQPSVTLPKPAPAAPAKKAETPKQ